MSRLVEAAGRGTAAEAESENEVMNPQEVMSALVVRSDHVELYRTNAQFKMQVDNLATFTLPALLDGMARQSVDVQAEIDRRIDEVSRSAEGRIFGGAR